MDDNNKYRVVLDTNQIVGAGSRWIDPVLIVESNKATKVIKAVARDHTGLYSGKIMGEYIEKLIDLGHPPKRVERYIGLLLGAFERVKVTSKQCSPMPSDLDDVIFLLCAIDGKANFVVSDDKHLLLLKEDYTDFRIINQSEAAFELGVLSAKPSPDDGSATAKPQPGYP